MLVLSRKSSETIRFPQLGISVSILSVKGNRVQVGITAPPEIRVLRQELESTQSCTLNSHTDSCMVASEGAKDQHDFRNRLNKATLGLHLAQKQLAAGRVEAADKTLATALSRLAELEASAVGSPSIADQQAAALPNKIKFSPASREESGLETCRNRAQPCIDVLLVEDDSNELALLRGILELEGYRVHTANNGREALDCLQRVTPQFILLDMMMPVCDGRETFQRIRRISALENLPIFAVSGASPDSLGLPIGAGGVEDWFPKPLNAPRLVERMRQRVSELTDCACKS
ncbi:MAG: response regulator [Pirellulaceae bacterium]|nr:response regulator [Pirellulaceae bacterium]